MFEETTDVQPDGARFNVYLSGLDRDISGLPMDQLSAAEFWGSQMFKRVTDLMIKCGVITEVKVMDKGGGTIQ